MSTRNPQQRTPTPVRPGRIPARKDGRSVPLGATITSDGQSSRDTGVHPALRNTPIEGHRLVAAFSLIAMLLLSLVPSTTASAPDPGPFFTPRIDGSGSVPGSITLGTGSLDQFSTMFPYRTLSEQAGENIASVWPEAGDALNYDPTSQRARRAIIGQLYASSSGGLNVRIKDSGLEGAPSEDKLNSIAGTYSKMSGTDDKDAKADNGLSALFLVRSITAPVEERSSLEGVGIAGFRRAVAFKPDVWQFTYNYSLANLLVGNYQQAYDGMRAIRFSAQQDATGINVLTYYWAGLAALRMGVPADAITSFREAVNLKAPAGSNEGVTREYNQAHDLAREGLADAQWANRTPAEAYSTYLDLLNLGTASSGVYNKWLRLGMEQHAYTTLVADIKSLIANSSPSTTTAARMHQDRARILTFLSRNSEAMDEYRLAAGLGEGDPALLVSYAQALEGAGDHDGALGQAQQAISKLGKDPTTADLTSVARLLITSTTTLEDRTAGQALLDATLVRARAWGHSGHVDLADRLASQIAAPAAGLPSDQAALLNLYSGFAYEAAGINDKAASAYNSALVKLGNLNLVQPVKGAALAGLARTTAMTKDAAAGLDVLNSRGYDPAKLTSSIVADSSAPDVLTEQSVLFGQAGHQKEAANALRLAAIVGNLRDAQRIAGTGRPLWAANGTSVPAQGMLAAADAQSKTGDPNVAKLRYRQAYGLDPALAPAFNNLGVLYASQGNSDRAKFYLQSAGAVSPNYVLGQQNLAAYSYKQGIGNFFTGEQAAAQVIKAVGPFAASRGYNLRADSSGAVPTQNDSTNDLLSRLPLFLLLALLLAHTLVGNDRQTNRMGLVPTRGVLGMLGQQVDARARAIAPGLFGAKKGASGALIAIAVPSVIGMLALAWHAGHGSLDVALVYLPVALLAALVAFGANELAQAAAARSNGASTLHHTSVLGTLLGIVGVPFGVMYGWGATTRVQPAVSTPAAGIAREAQVEAAADLGSPADGTGTEAAMNATAESATMSRLGLSKAAAIMFAGLIANLIIGLIFALAYWVTGWPSLRLALLGSALVLTFSAVSEPPADGWTLYRSNPGLWLGVFVLGAAVSALLLAGVI